MSWSRPISFFGFACVVFFAAVCGSAQPKSGLRLPEPIDPVEAARAGKALVSGLLSERPEAESSSSGTLTNLDRQGKTKELRVEFFVQPTASNVVSRYLAGDGASKPLVELTIIQVQGKPNQYLLGTREKPVPEPISGDALNKPFAGSEFSLGDLGLDFLHWPSQMVTGKQLKKGQSCEILESRPAEAAATGYSRVVTWIASQKAGIVIVHADAYDAQGRLLKQFEPKKLQRIQGQLQLREMEMRNRQTDARSTINFDLGGN